MNSNDTDLPLDKPMVRLTSKSILAKNVAGVLSIIIATFSLLTTIVMQAKIKVLIDQQSLSGDMNPSMVTIGSTSKLVFLVLSLLALFLATYALINSPSKRIRWVGSISVLFIIFNVLLFFIPIFILI